MNVVRPFISYSIASMMRRLGLEVDGAGGLVEDQDRRVLQESARERHALPLASGEGHAALADLRVCSPRASREMKSCALAWRAAASISSCVGARDVP